MNAPEVVTDCPACGSESRYEAYYVPGATGMPVTCTNDWHDEDAAEPGTQGIHMTATDLAAVKITSEALSAVERLRQQALSEKTPAYRKMRAGIETQPFAAVQEQPWYEPGSRIVAVDLAERPRLHRVARTAPKPPPAPLGVISSRWVETISCPPPPVFDPRQYGPYLRAVGAATGTRTDLEVESAWRLAIETGPFIGPLLPCRECGDTGMVWFDRCTCGTGPSGYYGMHERYCGAEPCPAGCPVNPEAVAS